MLRFHSLEIWRRSTSNKFNVPLSAEVVARCGVVACQWLHWLSHRPSALKLVADALATARSGNEC